MNARAWLRQQEYYEIADMIDQIIMEWKSQGKRTRRNWWDILAGSKDGGARMVAGKTFPILKAAQKRKWGKASDYAVCNKDRERAPAIQKQARWNHRSESQSA